MAIEESVSELNETIKELNRLLKHEFQEKAKTEQEKTESTGDSTHETGQPELEDVRSSLIRLKEKRTIKLPKLFSNPLEFKKFRTWP